MQTPLTISSPEVKAGDILTEWRWLIAEEMSIVSISALGDAFLTNPAGAVYWLDTGAGRIHPIASSVAEFGALCAEPENIDEWFMPQLVEKILASGVVLKHNEVLSYKLPPTLNGAYEPSNFEPTSIALHFAMLGSIQRGVKDHPNGAMIKRFVEVK